MIGLSKIKPLEVDLPGVEGGLFRLQVEALANICLPLAVIT